MSHRNVLIIAFHYPPDIAVGAIRPERFVSYLPQYGFLPIVLTVKEKYYEKLDDGILKEIKTNKKNSIFRTNKIPNFRDVYLFIKEICKKYHCSSDNTTLESMIYVVKNKDKSHETIKEKFKRYFNSLVVWLPDDKTGWIFPATWKGVKLIYQHKIDAIYTTGPPHSVHLIGLLLKLLTRKTWVADFRDPWIGSQKPSFVKTKLSDAIENWLEKKVVLKSDHVVSVTPEMTRRFQKRYPEISSGKFVTIYNGYDSEELSQYNNIKKYDKITFTYTGAFYLGRDPELFLRALRDLIEVGKIRSDAVQVKFIGDCRYLYEKSIEEMVERIGLTNIVSFVDHIPRNEALAEMAKSHVLLLLAPDQPLQIPGKVYEYMGIGAYILAISGAGATANILKKYSKSFLVTPGDEKGMRDSIFSMYQKCKEPLLGEETGSMHDFLERKILAEQLANIMN